MIKFSQKQWGITAIELIIILGIIAILVGALVPTLSQNLPGIQLNGITRRMVGDLREAQEKAITEQNQHLIRFNPLAIPPSYSMIRIYSSTEETLRTVNLASGETLTLAPTITSNQIIFSADGGPSSSGNITISNGSSSKIINVSPAGFIKLL